MHNTKPRPSDELVDIDQQISLKLWNLTDAHSKPTGLSPHVIYPTKRDKTIRISEQEARIVCCGILDNLSLYYSVENPTEKTYKQSGKKYMSAQTDLTIYTFDGQSFHRAINVEFKGPQATKKDVGKDVEKLVREGCFGGWFHILSNSNRGTFRSLFSKFKYGFIEYPKLFSPEKFTSKKISILFCFCVLAKQHAYLRHFVYEPSQNGYEEYVTSFFNASNLDQHWHIFVKKVVEGNIKRRNITTQPAVLNAESTRSSRAQKPWYYWQDRDNRVYILALRNGMGSCSLRRFDAENGEQLKRLPNQKGNYQDKFAEYLRTAQPLCLSHQPNLVRDCKERLPEWVMVELREQISNYRIS